MSKKIYKVISIASGVISVIGLVSYAGSIRSVNLGAFIFPALISIGTFVAYMKK